MALPDTADVVVVGAGLAGLAAATRLQQAGIETIVVEQGDAVGGRVRTDVVDGFRLDRGFQVLTEADARAQAGRLLGGDPARWHLLRADVIRHALPAHPAGQPLRQPVALGGGRYVCGDHRDTPSIQGALVSGRRAADAVRRALGGPAAQ